MRWQGRRQSDNVEDRRGMPAGRLAVGGGLGTIVLLVVVVLLGGDPQALLQQMQPPAGNPAAGPQQVDPAEQPLKDFVSVVLADTEDVWQRAASTATAAITACPSWCSTPVRCNRLAVLPAPRWGRSTVRRTKRSIWISVSARNCRRSTAPRAISRWPTCWLTRSVTTCRNWSAIRIWWTSSGDGSARPSRTSCRFAWNCRPTTWPASGLTMPNGRRRSWSRATWKKPSAPPAPWVTTGCRNRPRATSSRIRSLTEPPPSVHGGSAWACRPATWREPRNCSSCRRRQL